MCEVWRALPARSVTDAEPAIGGGNLRMVVSWRRLAAQNARPLIRRAQSSPRRSAAQAAHPVIAPRDGAPAGHSVAPIAGNGRSTVGLVGHQVERSAHDGAYAEYSKDTELEAENKHEGQCCHE